MGLRINQNIAALNAARNLRNTDNAMSRSLERLSSGFRINRAADDPAGLIISENLRAQISGLSQAIRNSQNAVNLIKTGEASLDEALKQLRSIRTLTLDALNTGASDSVARSADQTAITSSVTSLTRIANNTQFGKIKLLDGSAGITGSTSDSTVLTFVSATSKTQSGTFAVSGLTAATQGKLTKTLNNEFDTGKTNAAAALKLGTSDKLAFQVDFGAGVASSSDVAAIGADLKAAGLVADTSVSGITVQFDETNATAFIIVDQSAGGFTVDKVDGATSLRAALNSSSIGKVLTFNDDADDAAGGGTADELRISGKFAGVGFSVSDITNKSTADAGLTGAQAIATAASDFVLTSGDDAELIVDFGANLSLASEKASLGAALVAAGLATGTAIATNTTTAQVTSVDATNAKATIKLVSTGNTTIADAVTSLNKTSVSGFVTFAVAATKLTAVTDIAGVKLTDGTQTATGNAGFDAGVSTGTAVTALAAAEVADLGDGLASGGAKQTSNAVKLLQETLTFNGSKVVNITSGTLAVNLANVLNQQLDALGVGVGAALTVDAGAGTGSTLTLTNDAFGSTKATGGKNTVSSNRSDLLDSHLNIGGLDVSIEGTDVAGTINAKTATGVGQTLTLSSSGDNADGVAVKFTGTVDPTGLTVTVTQGSLNFQVGANTAQTVQQALPDVRATKLGLTATGLVTSAKNLNDIDVTTTDGANDALKLVDAAITEVTTARGNLGAFQANVLESTINSLGVAQENLASAESAIRDADFADETVQFTRNQILLQAGTAILTQANAIPQAVLQLLA